MTGSTAVTALLQKVLALVSGRSHPHGGPTSDEIRDAGDLPPRAWSHVRSVEEIISRVQADAAELTRDAAAAGMPVEAAAEAAVACWTERARLAAADGASSVVREATDRQLEEGDA